MINRLVAIVGMAGSGKTEAAKYLENKGLFYLRFGQVTIDEIRKRGLAINEKNERMVREELREKYGMAAYVKLNLPQIKKGLKEGKVVVDNLQSWEEYLFLKKELAEDLVVLAIYACPKKRYQRLAKQKLDLNYDKQAMRRHFKPNEAWKRDKAEIERTHKAGPIAMADYLIINEGTIEELHQNLEKFLTRFNL